MKINTIIASLQIDSNFEFFELDMENNDLFVQYNENAILINNRNCFINGVEKGIITENVKISVLCDYIAMFVTNLSSYAYVSNGSDISLTSVPLKINGFADWEQFFVVDGNFSDVFLSKVALVKMFEIPLNTRYISYLANYSNDTFEFIIDDKSIILQGGFSYNVKDVIFSKKLTIDGADFLFTENYMGVPFEPRIVFFSEDNDDYLVFDDSFKARYSLDNVHLK